MLLSIVMPASIAQSVNRGLLDYINLRDRGYSEGGAARAGRGALVVVGTASAMVGGSSPIRWIWRYRNANFLLGGLHMGLDVLRTTGLVPVPA